MDVLIDKKELSEFLTNAGCCRMCVLRFQKPRFDEYLKVENFAQKPIDQPADKKLKANPCVTCFGVFDYIDEILMKVHESEDLKQFHQVKTFFTSLFLPLSFSLAQLQMWLALLEKYPQSFDENKMPDVAVKDVLKHILNDKLPSELDKEFQVDGLMINIHFALDTEAEMLEKLKKAAPGLMKEWNGRKKSQRGDVMSRIYFEKHFTPDNINVTEFRKLIPIPPESLSSIRLEKIDFTGPTVFLAGRYNKFSRKLSQTPWVVNGKKLADESVEEIIVDKVLPHFQVNTDTTTVTNFMSSGREDVDVRCLGKGRPFALEILNSRTEVLDPSLIVEIEEKVRQSAVVSIRDVQMVRRDDLHQIKTGEESKKKFYRALCVLRDEKVSEKILEKLQIEEPFEIQQWTPIRVLHRRTLLKRPRTIFSVKAFAVKDKPNLIALDIVTQAGTYVKELVHGEFGRTTPSIASIIEKDIDITSLDVMNIDLDFPPSSKT